MTPQEFRLLRERTLMSQKQVARELDVDTRTIQRWEAGVFPIPYSVTRMLKLLAGPYTALTTFELRVARLLHGEPIVDRDFPPTRVKWPGPKRRNT